jgi:hypothetical protein
MGNCHKKSSNSSSSVQAKHSIRLTTFCDLCNDIILELFAYFSAQELFYSFNNVVINLPSLIRDSHIQLDIRALDEYTVQSVLPYIDLSQVISCEPIPAGWLDKQQILYLFRFPQLRSLVLRNITDPARDFSFLEADGYRVTKTGVTSADTIKLLHCIFSFLPTLNHCQFHATNIGTNLWDVQRNLLSAGPSNIEYFRFITQCSWSALAQILMFTPCLQILCATTVPDLFPGLRAPPPRHLDLLSLHTLQLTSEFVDLDELGQLIKRMPNLKRCRLEGQAARENEPLVESDRWRILLDEVVPQLNRLTINYLVTVHDRSWFNRFNDDPYFTKIKFKVRLDETSYQSEEYVVLMIQGDFKRQILSN